METEPDFTAGREHLTDGHGTTQTPISGTALSRPPPQVAEPPFFKQLNANLAEAGFDPRIEQRCLPCSQRLLRSLQGIRVWYRSNRHLPLGEQHTRLSRKLRGHDADYSITGNQRSFQAFREQLRRIRWTWLSRRNRQYQNTLENFARLGKRYSLPPPG